MTTSALLGRLLLLGVVAAGATSCSDDEPGSSYSAEDDTSVYDSEKAGRDAIFERDPSHFAGRITLADGRKIRMWYAEADGGRKDAGIDLMEQHYSPVHDAWTRPVSIYTSEEPHPCQGIELTEEDGVVAGIADFGLWCYDGEPPEDSLGLVASGDLTEWQVHSTPGFDGWTRMKIDGDHITWTAEDVQLDWTPDDGFEKSAR